MVSSEREVFPGAVVRLDSTFFAPDLMRGLIANICDEGSFDGSERSREVFD